MCWRLFVMKVYTASVWNNYVQLIKTTTRITDQQECSWSWTKIYTYMLGVNPLQLCFVNFEDFFVHITSAHWYLYCWSFFPLPSVSEKWQTSLDDRSGQEIGTSIHCSRKSLTDITGCFFLCSCMIQCQPVWMLHLTVFPYNFSLAELLPLSESPYGWKVRNLQGKMF